ncbi:molybdenum cofactor guanylyltransferase [Flagellimonas sediminis]|uniref:Probable molybdenum cofactor guanylyltransferase n=1 Tax=Flagellimonas sediminis TaxID=2696468 RepID=A0A6I5KSI4_9FLAO|nr:NTP transferase domain-containing protein [Allomuricauda sediminis]NDV42925.1 NTP transferase domain-containing protein [Allomuricauda sediminis]
MGAPDDKTLYGLVLDGGKSTRMGTDKGEIVYHESPHREYLMKLLRQICDAVFVGTRKGQSFGYWDFQQIEDMDQYKGPLNGILSAHEKYPNVAWLVLACDLPFVDNHSLQKLVRKRDTDKLATAYAHHNGQVPEPLFAIWEVSGLKAVKAYVDKTQKHSPRDFLMVSDFKLVHPDKDIALFNANSPTDYEWAKRKLQSNGE